MTEINSKNYIYEIAKMIDLNWQKFLKNSDEPNTLLAGQPGYALFFAYASRKYQDKDLDQSYSYFLDQSIASFSQIEQPSLYQGFTGTAWLMRHLVNQNMLTSSSLNDLNELDGHIYETINLYKTHRYYSLMYGYIGHGIYFREALLNQPNNELAKNALNTILDCLYDHSIHNKGEICWVDNTSLDYHEKRKTIYNLGIPHGIPGIILFLSYLIDLEIQVERCEALMNGALNWLRNRKTNFNNISLYPSLIDVGRIDQITRLSWAYGDLCLSYAFAVGYKYLKKELFYHEAIEALHITKERNVENSLIHFNDQCNTINPGICKGVCGIILLYDSINKLLNDEIALDLLSDWRAHLEKKLDLKDYTSLGHDEFGKHKWIIDTGFLEGLAGIGLTLLYLNDPEMKGWKNLLLLT